MRALIFPFFLGLFFLYSYDSFGQNQLEGSISTIANTVKNGTIKLRSDPSPFSEVIQTLPNSVEVNVLGYSPNGYYQVSFDGETGYLTTLNLQSTLELIKLKNQIILDDSESKNYEYSGSKDHKTLPPEESRKYIRGPRGGCYYINSKGNKTYVDRSKCN